MTPHNPFSRHASRLAQRVARELKRFGWKLGAVMTDNGSEFRARAFRDTVERLGAEPRFIRGGRPQTDGCVERVHGTILEECLEARLRPVLVPGLWGLRRDIFATTTRTASTPGARLAARRRWKSSAPTRCGQAGEPSHRLRIRTH